MINLERAYSKTEKIDLLEQVLDLAEQTDKNQAEWRLYYSLILTLKRVIND